jgi:hypothetical protein
MSKKMGRPTLPKGLSKDFQVGVRFNASDDKKIQKAIETSGAQKTKAQWIRDAARLLAEEWAKPDKWTARALHGKSVEFQLLIEPEGLVHGKGTFEAWERGDGMLKVRIKSLDRRKTTPFEKHEVEIHIPPDEVNLIEKAGAKSDCDFVFYPAQE